MRRFWPIVCLLGLMAAAGGCRPEERPSGRVVIFVLDSPVDADFVEGREATRPASDVSHGSLVGRVLRRYCRADLVSVAVEELDGSVSRAAYLSGLRHVLTYAAQHPADRIIVNISLGSREADPEEERLIRRLIAEGVLVVAAAGNLDSAQPDYPAGYPGVVAVANATREGKAPSSNYGPHVDIAASGDITFIDYEFLPYERLRREMEARGTSFAAPRVAAAVAWLMARRPALSPQQAYDVVRAMAVPIDDDYYRRGQLGAGLLNPSGPWALMAPGARFVHYVLPLLVWVGLGLLSAWLCLRYGMPGLFLALMIWLVALPVTVLSVIESVRYLEFVGGGSVAAGLGAVAVLAAGAALAAWVQRWNVAKTALALLLPYGAFGVLPAAGRAGLPAAVGAAAVGVGASAWLEQRTRRTLRALRAGAEGWGVARLVRLYHWSFDVRVRQAVVAAMGRLSYAEASESLLSERALPEDIVVALAEALLQADEPDALAVLQEAARRRRSPGIDRLFEELRGAAPSAPDAQ